jgi:hypothetical protein
MPGHGPPPKNPSKKARRNRDPIPLRIVQQTERAEPPLLMADVEWHPQVIVWWKTWIDSPLSQDFTTTDWQYLLETAFIQNTFWNGDMKVAAELRLRAQKFGATPEDRARLRIQVVTADEVEAKAEARASVPSSRGRYEIPGQAG